MHRARTWVARSVMSNLTKSARLGLLPFCSLFSKKFISHMESVGDNLHMNLHPVQEIHLELFS